MKRLYTTGLAIILLVLPMIGHAADCNTINIPDIMPDSLQITTIKNALINYQQGGVYGICFNMEEPLKIETGYLIEPFKIEIPAGETHNVYVSGLEIEIITPIDFAIFKAVNNGSGSLKVVDFNFKDIKKGLLLEGTGKTEIKSSTIAGDASKSGACIEVKSPGAVLSGVQVSSCGDGVRVDANGVQIKDESIIKGNKIGVHILSGREGAAISNSKIYYNDDGYPLTIKRSDGVRIDDGAMHEIVFYDVIDNEPVPILDGEDVIEYSERKAYILLDLPEGKTGNVEFFLSEGDDCGLDPSESSFKQVCGDVAGVTNPVSIEPSNLLNGPLEVTIPPNYYGKALVAVYNESERGTAGISYQFSLSGSMGGVVAFVSNPYDIPTSGGVTDADLGSGSEDDYTEDSSGDGMGGDGAVAEGGSIVSAAGGAAGGCGGGASLAGDTFRTSVILMDLWWNLLVVGLILSLRRAYVHVRSTRK